MAKCILEEYRISETATAGKETPFYVKGRVIEGSYENAGVAVGYVDGATDTITIIVNGQEFEVGKGEGVVHYIEYAEENKVIDMSGSIIFPEEGTYTIAFMGGQFNKEESKFYYDDIAEVEINVTKAVTELMKYLPYLLMAGLVITGIVIIKKK